MSKAGEIEIKVGDGYPVSCEIYYRGKYVAKIIHKELSDLSYAVRKAEQEAREALGDDRKHEVI